MRYLLVKEKNNKFNLYCPEIFGVETWGELSQKSLEKKRKYWYIHHWSAGNEWVEDENYDEKLNVVLETADIQKVVNYVSRETKGSQAAIGKILVQAHNIYCDYVAFENWVAARDKN